MNWCPPSLVLIASLILTTLATASIFYVNATEQQDRLDTAALESGEAIERRIESYIDALYHIRGFFNASRKVERNEYADFIRDLAISSRYPGIQGFGYSPRVGQTKESFPILYLEPDVQNIQKPDYGYNILANPIHSEAALRARNNNRATATKLSHFADAEKTDQKVFLIFLPLFQLRQPIETVEQRQKANTGLVYGIFRVDDFFTEITKELKKVENFYSIEVFENQDLTSSLFDSQKIPALASVEKFEARNLISKNIEVHAADHTWQVRSTIIKNRADLPLFSSAPIVVLVVGLLVSFLIYLVLTITRKHNAVLESDLIIRRQAAEATELAKKAAENATLAKSQFLANMSHEIRTPLSVVLGFTDLAMELDVENTKLQSYLTGIKRNAGLLTSIIGDILDLSKIEANKMTLEISRVSLKKLVEEVVEVLGVKAQAKNLALPVNLDPGLPAFVTTDPTRVKQVLFNLIGNSIKFTQSGFVSLDVRPEFLPVINQKFRLVFTIRDTGVGIPESFRATLFQAFSQADPNLSRKFGGAGLGLFLSKEIARTLGGDLTLVESQVGAGTVFNFTIPMGVFDGKFLATTPETAGVKPEAKESMLADRIQRLKNKRVLLVEDSIDNQVLATTFLNDVRMVTDVADNGEVAIKKALTGNYDLVLMDIQMPVLDGNAATKELRRKGYKKPIIALTAHALTEEREKAMKSGFNAYLTKPYSRAKLYECIEKVLG